MKFRFKQFEFDCEQLILKQDGKIFELNEKPAQLLLLFLTQADKIHSKHDILDRVWSGRVVSDQVVFQISVTLEPCLVTMRSRPIREKATNGNCH